MIISGRAVSITTTKHQPPTANAARVHALHLHLHFTADKEGWYVFEWALKDHKSACHAKLLYKSFCKLSYRLIKKSFYPTATDVISRLMSTRCTTAQIAKLRRHQCHTCAIDLAANKATPVGMMWRNAKVSCSQACVYCAVSRVGTEAFPTDWLMTTQCGFMQRVTACNWALILKALHCNMQCCIWCTAFPDQNDV